MNTHESIKELIKNRENHRLRDRMTPNDELILKRRELGTYQDSICAQFNEKFQKEAKHLKREKRKSPTMAEYNMLRENILEQVMNANKGKREFIDKLIAEIDELASRL